MRIAAHDVRNRLSVTANALMLLREGRASDPEANELLDMAEEGLRSGTDILQNVDKRILPEHPLGIVHGMIAEEIERLCTRDLKLAGKCVFEQCSTFAWDPASTQIEHEAATGPLRITLHALPPELKRDKIPCTTEVVQRMFDNLVKNAVRKGARQMRVSFSRSNHHEVCLSVSDDSEGMILRILHNLRKGISDTDKTPEDGIDPGHTSEDHGLGVLSIREMVVEQGGGRMEIFSVKKAGVKDPEGDAQDEESLSQHPFKHGVTFRFMYEVKNVEPNGDHAPTPERNLSRRRVMQIGGGVATAAAVLMSVGVHYALRGSRESVEDDMPESPITDIELDENGRLRSFVFSAFGERGVYEPGKPLPDVLRDVRTIPMRDGSVTAIEPAAIDGLRLRPMFVCATPQGIFGDVNLPRERGQLDAYLCALRGAGSGRVDLSPFTLYLKRDTLFNLRIDPAVARAPRAPALESRRPPYDSTSIALLQSRAFGAMQSSLQNAVNLPMRQSDGSSFNSVRPILIKALSAHNVLSAQGVHVKDPAQLRELLPARDRFILAEEPVVEALRRDPLTPEEAATARKNNVTIALPRVSPAEAQAMIRTPEA